MNTVVSNYLLVQLIIFYRKFISPYKGYRCAYSAEGYGLSCSTFGLKVFSRFPFLTAFRLQYRQFHRCRGASKKLQRGELDPRIVCIVCCGSCGESKRPGSDWSPTIP